MGLLSSPEGSTRELLLLVAQLNCETNGSRAMISETAFQKILYDFREKVEDDKIKSDLHFYWYKHGPYSPEISNALGRLVVQKVLSVSVVNGQKLYQLSHKLKETAIQNVASAKTILVQILEEIDIYHISNLVKKIYEKAPYPFMPIYKMEYLRALQEYLELLEHETDSNDLKFLKNYQKKIGDYLYESEYQLPDDELFTDFNTIFSNMVGEISQIFSQNKVIESTLLNEITKISESAWTCFAKGLRIAKHDSYYDENVSRWEEDFRESVDFYRANLVGFNQLLLQKEILSSSKVTEFSEGNDVLEAIVKGYNNA
jgi:uncharacterized phage-associated protein